MACKPRPGSDEVHDEVRADKMDALNTCAHANLIFGPGPDTRAHAKLIHGLLSDTRAHAKVILGSGPESAQGAVCFWTACSHPCRCPSRVAFQVVVAPRHLGVYCVPAIAFHLPCARPTAPLCG